MTTLEALVDAVCREAEIVGRAHDGVITSKIHQALRERNYAVEDLPSVPDATVAEIVATLGHAFLVADWQQA